jgi:hypothetical protein
MLNTCERGLVASLVCSTTFVQRDLLGESRGELHSGNTETSHAHVIERLLLILYYLRSKHS